MPTGLRTNTSFAGLVANLKENCHIIHHTGSKEAKAYLVISYGKYTVSVAPHEGGVMYVTPHHVLEEIHSGALRIAYAEIIAEHAKLWGVSFDLGNPRILPA